MDLSNSTKEKLEKYCSNILKWNKTYNLVSSSQTEKDIWERHILDSLQLYDFISDNIDSLIVDYGSGAGFPAIPCSILAEQENKPLKFTMLESINKKASFLQDTTRLLQLKNTNVICERIENIKNIKADIITARAFAKINEIFNISKSFLKDNTKFILMKGKNIQQEIDIALIKYNFKYQIVNSIQGDGFIFIAENLKNK